MTSLRAALAIWNDALRTLAAQALFVAGVLLPLFLVAGLLPAAVQTVDTPLTPRQMHWVGVGLAAAVYTLMAALWLRRQVGQPGIRPLWALFWRVATMVVVVVGCAVFGLIQIYRVAGTPGTSNIPALAVLNSLLALALIYLLLRFAPILGSAARGAPLLPAAAWRVSRGHGATLVWVAVLGLVCAGILALIGPKLAAIPLLSLILWFARLLLALSLLGAACIYIETNRAPD